MFLSGMLFGTDMSQRCGGTCIAYIVLHHYICLCIKQLYT
jgi:hypothetical protein